MVDNFNSSRELPLRSLEIVRRKNVNGLGIHSENAAPKILPTLRFWV